MRLFQAPSWTLFLILFCWVSWGQPCDHIELTHVLHSLARNHSSIAALHSLGRSLYGRELWVMTLGDSVTLRPVLRPQVKLVGNINGFSGPSCEVLVALVQTLLGKYEDTGSEERQLLQNLEIQVLFNMNPDGYANSSKGSCTDQKGRFNGNGVDLNTNFPGVLDDPEEAGGKVREPETEAVKEWILQNKFVLSLSFTTGHSVVVTPFDDDLDLQPSPDDDLFQRLASKYSEAVGWRRTWNCPILQRNFTQGWVPGSHWYPKKGTMMDFSYLCGTPELTIGVSCCRNEANEQAFRTIWQRSRKGIYKLLWEARGGLKGQVVDAITRDVLEGVELSKINHDIELPPMPWHTSRQGEFFRLLSPGVHLLEVIHPQYKKTRVEVEVKNGEAATILNIELDPLNHKYYFPTPEPIVEETSTISINTSITTTAPSAIMEPTTMKSRQDKFHSGLGVMLSALTGTSFASKFIPNLVLTIVVTFLNLLGLIHNA